MPDTAVPSPELSHARGRDAIPLLEQTIGQALDVTARAHGDREALVESSTGRRWSWTELVHEVDHLTQGFIASGVRTGDRVGIWAPNCAEWTLVQLATARMGAILVTIDPSYRTHELAHVINQSGISSIVVAEPFGASDYPAMVEQVRHECPSLAQVLVIGRREWDTFRGNAHQVTRGRLAEVQGQLAPTDPIAIQYTAGTTGCPKGATLSHRTILNTGYFVGLGCGYTEQDVVCIPAPFNHHFGMVMGTLACLTHGATMVIPGPGFDPAATLRTVREEGCTSLCGVPTMFLAMFELIDADKRFSVEDLRTVRTGIVVGSASPPSVTQRLLDAGVKDMTTAYGMTETSSMTTQTSPLDPFEKKVGTVGRVAPHLEIQIVDPGTREVVPRGEPGELCTKGYSVMLGYWQDPDQTAEAVRDGWMATGDIGVMDDQGYVQITGRTKDLMVPEGGGEG